MYGQAAELNPSSTGVRDGRFKLSLIWVRNFQVDKSKLDETLSRIIYKSGAASHQARRRNRKNEGLYFGF